MTEALENETPDAYRTRLRGVLIRVADEQGYCDTGLNEVLRELGLPEKRDYFIKVEVPSQTMTVKLRVRDAQSDEEARDMLRRDPERTLRSIQREVGFPVTEFAVPDAPPQPADPAVPVPPQPCPEEGEWYATSLVSGGPNQCRVRSEEDGNLYCTRPVGHAADWHVAAGKNAGVLETWQAQAGDVRPDPAPAMPEPEAEDDYSDDDDD